MLVQGADAHLAALLFLVAPRPPRERRPLLPRGAQFVRGADQLDQDAGERTLRGRRTAVMRHLPRTERDGHGQRNETSRETQPAHRGVVEEQQDEGRQQKDSRQQRPHDHARHLVAQTVEGHGARPQVADRESAVEDGRQVQQAIPKRRGEARRDAAFETHQGRALKHVEHGRRHRQQQRARRQPSQQPRAPRLCHRIGKDAEQDRRRQRDQTGQQPRCRESEDLAPPAAECDPRQRADACRPTRRQRLVEEDGVRLQRGRPVGVHRPGPARCRVHHAVSSEPARQQRDRRAALATERKHRAAVAEPPAVTRVQCDLAPTHARRTQNAIQRRSGRGSIRMSPRSRRIAEADALVAANQCQRRLQREAARFRQGAAHVEQVEQAAARGGFAFPAIARLRGTQIDGVRQQQAAVEVVGAHRQTMEIGQRRRQASRSMQLARGAALKPGRAVNADPASGRQGHEAGTAGVGFLGAQECQAALPARCPHDAALGRNHRAGIQLRRDAGRKEALDMRPMRDVRGHGGRDFRHPAVRLIDDGAVLVRLQEHAARHAPQLGTGQALGHEHVRTRRGKQQPAASRAKETLVLDEFAVLLAHYEHVRGTSGDEPKGIGVVQTDGPVAASGKRFPVRRREVFKPGGGQVGGAVRAWLVVGKGLALGGVPHRYPASMSRR